MQMRSEHPYMSDNEITESIIQYIDEDIYNYAVMIDGEWGCGKTHYVKMNLIGKIIEHEEKKEKDKRRKVIYISLYGINSVEEISKQIILAYCLSNKDEKLTGLLQTGAKIAGAALSIFAKDIKTDDASETLVDFISTKNIILIFDDLERCVCSINEVLGYINSFVEQDGMKVIIVANEKEIGYGTFQDNQELKYLLALHPGIKFTGIGKMTSIAKLKQNLKRQPQGEQQELVPIETDELRWRVEELFGQNATYERVKEKLIGNTIHYRPKLHTVFEQLIGVCSIRDELKTTLKDKLTFFEEYMLEEEHPNLRTFQFYLSKMQDLYEVISTLDGDGRDAFLDHVEVYCFKICVCYKSGAYTYNWKDSEEYGFQRIGSREIFSGQLCFRFVDDFIIGGYLDLNSAKRMFEMYKKEYIWKDNQQLDALRKLELYWFISSEEEVVSEIAEMTESLANNRYPFEGYTRIINILLQLKNVGFSEDYVSNVISIMKDNISKITEYVHLDRGFSLDPDSKYREQHTKIMDELQKEVDKHFQEKATNDIDYFLTQGDGWGNALYEYIQKNYQTVVKQTGFLSNLDISNLVLKLENSSACDLNAFRSCIIRLYTELPIEPALKQDEVRLVSLKQEIERIDIASLDKIQKLQINLMIKNLSRAITLYEQEKAETTAAT